MSVAAARAGLASRRGRLIAVLILVLIGLAAILAGTLGRSAEQRVTDRFVQGTAEGASAVRLDTSLYLPAATPAPAVLLTQGFGGDKGSLDATARTLSERGYVVLTYSARGFGRSGGLIHFANPRYEIQDGRRLLDHLAALPEVRKVDGRPQLAVGGSSYGGGISLLLAAYDPRVQAVAADITWSNLSAALFPNFGGSGPGIYKKLWAGNLFGNAFPRTPNPLLGGPRAATSGPPGSPAVTPATVSCGRFAPEVCAAYQASAAAGAPTPAMTQLMRAASPSSVLSRITAPTLLTQGDQDSLFPLSDADANARGIAAAGTPVRVVWRPGGHDGGGAGRVIATDAAGDWFGSVFQGRPPVVQPFRFTQEAGSVSAQSGETSTQTVEAAGYPGIAGTPRRTTSVALSGRPQPIAGPAGGSPAVISSIPGLGGISNRFDQAVSTTVGSVPGQTAAFASSPLAQTTRVVGASTVRLRITSRSSTDAQLFVGLRDLAPDGTQTLPSQLVNPVRVTGLTPGQVKDVTVQLPSFVRNVQAGHRVVVTVSATDFAYAAPAEARSYVIALPGDTTNLTIPTSSGTAIDGGRPFAWLIVGASMCLVVAALVTGVILRRRRVLKTRPDLAEVPISIESLTKEYAGGYRAVDDVSITVRPGQVVGLLGPNGAGKTTTLRVLVGLITPTAGELHVFGEPVYPGAPVLARLGAFIEGPGFLPHLTGRENLRLYWAATGRPPQEAEFDVALDIAGLGGSVDRQVRTYSHGMKQRLGIAQAMLGLPEVLVLDEPTNGLDPPQIAEMREMLQDYARTGRTVVVSSHLLAEVEQTCTDVVVMHKGRLVASGSVAEIAGPGGQQLAVRDASAAAAVLAQAGISAELVPARRALEDVFLGLIGDEEQSGDADIDQSVTGGGRSDE